MKRGRTNKDGFAMAWAIFASALVLLGGAFVLYVGILVKQYDASTPEALATKELEIAKQLVQSGRISEYTDYPSFGSEKFEDTDIGKCKSEYDEFLGNAKNFELAIKAGEGSGLEKVYVFYADDVPFMTLKLSGTNSRTKLVFFTMADWSVSERTAISNVKTSSLEMCIPDGVCARVNGREVGKEEFTENGADGIPKYMIRNLANTPKIEFSKDGEQIGYYTSDRGCVCPALYDYKLTLQKGISVRSDGRKVKETDGGDGKSVFEVMSVTEPDIEICDMFGNTVKYKGQAEIGIKQYTVSVPENYAISAHGVEIPKSFAVGKEHPDIDMLTPYTDAEIPGQSEYVVSSLEDKMTFTITDNSGASYERTLENYTYSTVVQAGAELPDELAKSVSPIEVAKCWSLFMINDRTLAQVKEYLIEGSYYAKFAKKWTTSIDSTFIADHRQPYFSDECVKNYTRYGDDCFSVDVSFTKKFDLVKKKKTEVENFNKTIYFVLIDDTKNNIDDPQWKIAVMHDIF